MKLKQLIEAEADLIKAAAKDRLKGELEAKSGYRVAAPDLEQEIDLEKAREMLVSKGYLTSSIDTVLGQSQQNELIVAPETDIENIDDAVRLLHRKTKEKEIYNQRKIKEKEIYEEAKDLYNRINETRKFMLKYLVGSGINLEFATKIGGLEAITKIRSWPKFVSIDVVRDKQDSSYNQNYDYSIDFGTFYTYEISRHNGTSKSLHPLDFFPVIGQIFLLIDIIGYCINPIFFSFIQIQPSYIDGFSRKNAIDALIKDDKRKIIYEHMAQLKEETERALIKIAKERALPPKQEYLLPGKTDSRGPK